jgi:hypothetical protein
MENYHSFVQQHLVRYFGTLPVGDITHQRIEAFIAAKRSPGGSTRFRDKPLAEESLRVGLVALRLIFDRAVKAGVLPANPAVGVARFGRREEDHVDPFTTWGASGDPWHGRPAQPNLGRVPPAVGTVRDADRGSGWPSEPGLGLPARAGCHSADMDPGPARPAQDAAHAGGIVPPSRGGANDRVATRVDPGIPPSARCAAEPACPVPGAGGVRVRDRASLGGAVGQCRVETGPDSGGGSVPERRATPAHLRFDPALPERSPALRPAAGRVEQRGGPPPRVRPLAASGATGRNPGATGRGGSQRNPAS